MDGLKLGTIGPPPRRWDASNLINLILEEVKIGEEPSTPTPGRLWRYEGDARAYFDDASNFNQLAYTGEPQPPQSHGNEKHSPKMVEAFFPSGAYYNAADVTVGTSPTIILSCGSFLDKWIIPSAGFNFRPAATNTADLTLTVYWRVSLAQRSAQYPITVFQDEGRRPFYFGLPIRDMDELIFWQTKFSSTPTISLMGFTDAENVIVSNRYINLVVVG